MAGGLGVRLFVSGDVITAADVNGYLMNQTMMRFATTTARDTAFGNGIPIGQTVGGVNGDGKPLLQEGMFAYIDSTNDVLFFDGAQWVSAPQFTLSDGAVTTIKIANDAVTNDKIAPNAISNTEISSSAAIDLDKLADATIDEKSASYTLALTDKNKFIKMSVTATANTITVPTNASVAFPVGSQIHIIQYGTGKTQVIPVSGTVTIYATPGTFLRAQYSSATLLKCDTNIWMLMGDLSAT